jgi:cysteine desulfurase
MPEPVYLDHAATTPVREEVLAAMLPFFGPRFGNPSSVHRWGREARTALDEARERVARCLGASPDEIVFTSCGTEADNMALIGVWRARHGEGRRAAVSTPIEHKAVLGALHQVAREGGEERLLAVDASGLVTAESVESLVRDDAAVCSVMWVNNEIGTVQDVPALAARAKERGVVFHSDAVQAFGKVEIDARRTPFDMLSISGHKIGAPKGIGALYIRRGTPMEALMFGGSQDRGRRPGTENVAMAVGLACAAELTVAEREEEVRRLGALRDRMEAALLARTARHEHLDPGHGERVDADRARPARDRLFGRLRMPEREHQPLARAGGDRRAGGRRQVGASPEPGRADHGGVGGQGDRGSPDARGEGAPPRAGVIV